MKVLVIGGGGREHAIVKALQQSDRVTELVCAPGNGGIAADARCVAVNAGDLDDLMRLIAAERPDFTVVGPELPLSIGFVDAMLARGLRVFGPTQAAAQLETSKAFAKQFMQRHNIPTAKYAVCETPESVDDALGLFSAPVVVKADGLAAGKGVVICEDIEEARETAKSMLAGTGSGASLGAAGARVVLEEFLEGEEVSLLLLSDGGTLAPMLPAQDHKRAGDNDTGPNTGGMGAYCVPSLLEPEMLDWIVEHIAQPTIDGMCAEGARFVGVLYCGLMMTASGPKVLEFNTRFGDPETEAILPLLKSDLLTAFEACAEGRLSDHQLRWHDGASACVVAASGGYPGKFTSGYEIANLADAAKIPDVTVYHAGTAAKDGKIVTSGGRVLCVAATGGTLDAALDKCYAALARVKFDGMYYRRDIGNRAIGARRGEKHEPVRTDVL